MEVHEKDGWKLELDEKEIFHDDPGKGAPAMVVSPGDETATYHFAIAMGILSSNDEEIPYHIMQWLDSKEHIVHKFISKE